MSVVPHLEPGTTIHGTWRVERFVGEGAMGSVYKATAIRSDWECAIKVIRHDLMSSDEAGSSFKSEEARQVKLGGHPCVRQADPIGGYREMVPHRDGVHRPG